MECEIPNSGIQGNSSANRFTPIVVGVNLLMCVRRCPTFPPVWVVSSALAGLASGFGMGPAFPCRHGRRNFIFWAPCWGVLWWGGCGLWVWLRGVNVLCCTTTCVCLVLSNVLFVVVSFRPVSASSLHLLLGL